MDYILIAAGLIGLFLGGEALVRGSVSIAGRLAISPFVIGLTVVGFGTSAPELLVSVQAAIAGSPDIAVGNIVGSNIANALLIVGLTALVWPITVARNAVRRDLIVMVAAALVLVPFFADAQIGRLAGLALVIGLIAYLVWTFVSQKQSSDETAPAASPLWTAILFVLVGLGALLLGARFLITGSVAVAQQYGVSEAFIGLTIIAVGTSLPELATSIIAALRKQSDIAIGNILGSNIFNVLGILGATAMISPIRVAERFLQFDLPVMLGASVALSALLLWRARVGRLAGGLLVIAYTAYIIAAQ